MASKFQEEVNKSAGKEVRVPCINCAGRTAHDIALSIDQSGYEPDYDLDWNRSYQVIRCRGCRVISFREASSTSDDYMQVGHDEWEPKEIEKLFPSRVEGRKDLGDDSIYLPIELRRIYSETVQALVSNSPVLAGIGLRAIVETVCKEKNASGNDLFAKINDLAAKHILTPSGASILHKVRTLGNRAAHEVEPHTPTQVSLAMGVIEHLLKDVYILPKLVENEF